MHWFLNVASTMCVLNFPFQSQSQSQSQFSCLWLCLGFLRQLCSQIKQEPRILRSECSIMLGVLGYHPFFDELFVIALFVIILLFSSSSPAKFYFTSTMLSRQRPFASSPFCSILLYSLYFFTNAYHLCSAFTQLYKHPSSLFCCYHLTLQPFSVFFLFRSPASPSCIFTPPSNLQRIHSAAILSRFTLK